MVQLHRVVVSVDADEPDVVSDIADRLSQAGLDVDYVLDELATITGTCDADTVDSLQSVPGVLEVETERTYQLAPPDRDVQ